MSDPAAADAGLGDGPVGQPPTITMRAHARKRARTARQKAAGVVPSAAWRCNRRAGVAMRRAGSALSVQRSVNACSGQGFPMARGGTAGMTRAARAAGVCVIVDPPLLGHCLPARSGDERPLGRDVLLARKYRGMNSRDATRPLVGTCYRPAVGNGRQPPGSPCLGYGLCAPGGAGVAAPEPGADG